MGKGLKFMKKFLSIITLACLLALGMALPAAAEGEDTMLYAAFSEEGPRFPVLFLPTDVTRNIYFFTTSDLVEFTPVTEGTYTVSGDAVEFSSTDGVNRVTGLKVTEEGAPVKITKDGPALTRVDIKVVTSRLEAFVNGGSSPTTKINLEIGESVGVAFRLGAQDIYDDVSEYVTVAPASGLSLSNGSLSATTAGDYTLNYKEGKYSIPVRVSGSSATIAENELEHLKDSEKDFVSFLYEKKGYSGSGDFTLLLPDGDFENVICNAQLPNGANLILKGAEGKKTNMLGLTINGENVSIDGVRFSGNKTAITLNSPPDYVCSVSNCEFGRELKYAFSIKQTSDYRCPYISLQGNDFPTLEANNSSNVKAQVVDSNGNEVGIWLMKSGTKAANAVINFSADITRNEPRAIWLYFGDKESATNNGWIFNFQTNCSFTPAYTVYAEKEQAASKLDGGKILVTAPDSGLYTVIKGSYPAASNGKVVITEADAIGLREVTVDTKFANATVTVGNKKVPAAVNNNKLTFTLDGEGTYTITEIKTTTTATKSSTTSRSYKYTYQDYYQVTPAGFTNAMRYVKDNLVTLNCTEAGSRSISLPVASMAAAAEKGYSVLVKTKNAELTLDAAALKSIAQQAKGTTVLLHYKSLNHKTLTTVGQASIQSHLAQFPGDNADLAFLVTATSDSETIEDLQMGTITLRIPFILLPGTEGMANTVYALQSESIAEARETTVADGHLTTKLLDLTEHMVFLTSQAPQSTEETTVPAEETMEPTVETIAETTQPETVPETTQPPVETEKQGGSPILTIVIVLGVVLVIGGGALGFLLLRRRFRK